MNVCVLLSVPLLSGSEVLLRNLWDGFGLLSFLCRDVRCGPSSVQCRPTVAVLGDTTYTLAANIIPGDTKLECVFLLFTFDINDVSGKHHEEEKIQIKALALLAPKL